MDKLYFNAFICGGRGDNVWDKELLIQAENIRQALDIAECFQGSEAVVTSVQEYDEPVPADTKVYTIESMQAYQAYINLETNDWTNA